MYIPEVLCRTVRDSCESLTAGISRDSDILSETMLARNYAAPKHFWDMLNYLVKNSPSQALDFVKN